MDQTSFHNKILQWYDINRRSFPWRYVFDPYKVMLAEFFLIQTDAPKVTKVYSQFLSNYPDVKSLSNAEYYQIKPYFNQIGLVYRAERIIGIAKEVSNKYGGIFPCDKEMLMNFKGIGDYIASAILLFGYNIPSAIVDTNIIRLYKRIFSYESKLTRPREDRNIRSFAKTLLPVIRFVDFSYGLLDFAALICSSKKPKCVGCIFSNECLDNIRKEWSM